MFKTKIKILAAQKGLTLLEVSKLSGVTSDFIYRLVNHKVDKISVSNLAKLKSFFKCPISDLIDFDEVDLANDVLKTVDNQEEYVLNSSQKNNIK